LKHKGLKKEIAPKVGVDDLGTSTTLESNKSLADKGRQKIADLDALILIRGNALQELNVELRVEQSLKVSHELTSFPLCIF
jgi:hypothetical protein